MSPAPLPPVPYDRTAARPGWPDLPAELRTSIEARLGAPVVHARAAGGGFTRGFAAVLRTASNMSVFVKAAPRAEQPHLCDWYAREAAVTAALPAGVAAPRLRWALTCGEHVVICLEAVDGRMPGQPWRHDELDATLRAYAATAEALRDPTPELCATALPKLAEIAATDLSWWQAVAEGRRPMPSCPPYAANRLADLVTLEAMLPQHAVDGGVIHCDLRPDNVLIDRGGAAWFCDWTWICRGPAWFDLTGLLITAYASGLDADAYLATHPAARNAPPDGIDAALAALSGYWLGCSVQPVDTAVPVHQRPSPHLRQHQRWNGEVALAWLAARRGWR